MIIDCLACLHGHYPKLEGGDLLIVAGDLTANDTEKEVHCFLDWLAIQPYELKVFIGGNHDNLLFKSGLDPHKAHFKMWTYLCDSGTEFEFEEPDYEYGKHSLKSQAVCLDGPLMLKTTKLKIWGSPWTRSFEGMNPKCKAFTLDTEEELFEKWALIPEAVDILVTHSPPCGFLDRIDFSEGESSAISVGSTSLLKKCYESKGIFPRIHVFGHIHEEGGQMIEIGGELWPNPHPTLLINASHVNERYEPVNPPMRITL